MHLTHCNLILITEKSVLSCQSQRLFIWRNDLCEAHGLSSRYIIAVAIYEMKKCLLLSS